MAVGGGGGTSLVVLYLLCCSSHPNAKGVVRQSGMCCIMLRLSLILCPSYTPAVIISIFQMAVRQAHAAAYVTSAQKQVNTYMRCIYSYFGGVMFILFYIGSQISALSVQAELCFSHFFLAAIDIYHFLRSSK